MRERSTNVRPVIVANSTKGIQESLVDISEGVDPAGEIISTVRSTQVPHVLAYHFTYDVGSLRDSASKYFSTI